LVSLRSQLRCHAFEELIDNHPSCAADHSLAQAGDRSPCAYVSRIFECGICVVRSELNGSFALDETRSATTVDAHLVFRGGFQIMQANRALKDASDGAHPELHLQVIGSFTTLLKLFTTGQALGNSGNIG